MLTSSRYRFYWVNFGIPLACAVAVFLMFDMTKIDIAFSDLFYDPVTGVSVGACPSVRADHP